MMKPRRLRRCLRRQGASLWLIALSLIAIAVLSAALFFPAIRQAREPARRSTCKNNLKQIGIALHNYHDEWGCLPPAYTVDADGKPLHSWRTIILPYLEQSPLYETIDLSKPWDDPGNLKYGESRLHCYSCPSAIIPQNHTTYLAVVTDQSAFQPKSSKSLRQMSDGTSNTLWVVEVDPEHAVPWMKPTDADAEMLQRFSQQESEEKLPHPVGRQGLIGDGVVRLFAPEVPAKQWRALSTADAGDAVSAMAP